MDMMSLEVRLVFSTEILMCVGRAWWDQLRSHFQLNLIEFSTKWAVTKSEIYLCENVIKKSLWHISFSRNNKSQQLYDIIQI